MSVTEQLQIDQVNFDDLKKDFNKYFISIEQGKPLTIIKEGKPVAEILPLTSQINKKRPYGLCAGDFKLPDDFNAPLPNDIIQDFEK